MKRAASIVGVSIFCMSMNTSVALAASFDEIVGEWIVQDGPNRGETLEVRPNGDTVDSAFGRGRIAPTTEWTANYKIVYRGNIKCFFYMRVSGPRNDRRLTVRLMSPGEMSHHQCIDGYFERANDNSGPN